MKSIRDRADAPHGSRNPSCRELDSQVCRGLKRLTKGGYERDGVLSLGRGTSAPNALGPVGGARCTGVNQTGSTGAMRVPVEEEQAAKQTAEEDLEPGGEVRERPKQPSAASCGCRRARPRAPEREEGRHNLAGRRSEWWLAGASETGQHSSPCEFWSNRPVAGGANG